MKIGKYLAVGALVMSMCSSPGYGVEDNRAAAEPTYSIEQVSKQPECVQLGAFTKKQNALNYSLQLMDKGIDYLFIESPAREGGHYRVRHAPEKTATAAKKSLSRIVYDCFVAKTPDNAHCYWVVPKRKHEWAGKGIEVFSDYRFEVIDSHDMLILQAGNPSDEGWKKPGNLVPFSYERADMFLAEQHVTVYFDRGNVKSLELEDPHTAIIERTQAK